MLRKHLLQLVAAWCVSASAVAATIPDSLLQPADEQVEFWLQAQRHNIIKLVPANADLVASLTDARKHIEDVLPNHACDNVPASPNISRACQFASNLHAYANYVENQQCRIDEVLEDVTEPATPADTVKAAANTVMTDVIRATDLFTVGHEPLDNRFDLFAAPIPKSEGCSRASPPKLAIVKVPANTPDITDKLILGYALILSEVTFNVNRPFMQATADRIKLADARWKQFEENVLHDQFPWETLIFNDWLAPQSDKFRGTLMYPPTRQIRAIHPVPTAIFDASGGDALFRPRISIEVVGLRMLDPDAGYTPKRAVSIIALPKAEEDEDHGWGLLYVWKKASVGVVHQKRDDDDVFAIVVGIDLANQIQSRRNQLMTQWQKLRDEIKKF